MFLVVVFKVEIRSHSSVSLIRLKSVHSGSASPSFRTKLLSAQNYMAAFVISSVLFNNGKKTMALVVRCSGEDLTGNSSSCNFFSVIKLKWSKGRLVLGSFTWRYEGKDFRFKQQQQKSLKRLK